MSEAHSEASLTSAQFSFDTARLHVRPLLPSDAEFFCRLYGDPDTMRFIGPVVPPDKALRSFLRALQLNDVAPPRDLIMTLISRADSSLAGICSLQGVDLPRRCAEAGIIIDTQQRARGFAREGLSGLAMQAFRVLPLDEIWVQIAPDHRIVERLVISVGFTPRRDAQRADYGHEPRVWSVRRDSWFRKRITT